VLVLVAAECVQAFDSERGRTRLHAEPDRRADNEDVGGHDLAVDVRPVVALVTNFGGVLDHAETPLMVEHVDQLNRHTFGAYDASDTGAQTPGMGFFASCTSEQLSNTARRSGNWAIAVSLYAIGAGVWNGVRACTRIKRSVPAQQALEIA